MAGSELRALRLSVGATQRQMADQIGLTLRAYRALENREALLDDHQLRSATFAALRIAVGHDSDARRANTDLFRAFDQLFKLFEQWHRSRVLH
jgi:transcriptional regulator with XRE-family HTH domain